MTMVREFSNARVWYKNFIGSETEYTRKGDRYFVLRFHPIQGEELKEEGWNVRESRTGMHTMMVKIDPDYDVDLGRLDLRVFETAEVIVEARPWYVEGRGEGYTAFLISITPNQ